MITTNTQRTCCVGCGAPAYWSLHTYDIHDMDKMPVCYDCTISLKEVVVEALEPLRCSESGEVFSRGGTVLKEELATIVPISQMI